MFYEITGGQTDDFPVTISIIFQPTVDEKPYYTPKETLDHPYKSPFIPFHP